MIPVVDGHNDALLRLWRNGGSLLERSGDGHLDVPRMREGGIAAAFFAVFVPAQDEEAPDPRSRVVPTDDGWEVPLEVRLPFERADRVARELAAILERDGISIVRDASELERCIAAVPNGASGCQPLARRIGAILHLEGAEPIEPGLGNLDAWFGRGMRSLGLVWSRPNAFGRGVPFRYPGTPDDGPGLTDAGRALVRACNELGVMVDLAHLNERGFFDVARITNAPLVVSHAAAHALAPVPRNLTDAQLDAVRDSGGLVGVYFDVPMTRADGDLVDDTPLDVVLDHVEHLAERMGVDHVAIGSDFDGCFVPPELRDASRMQGLPEALAARGWSEGDLRALAHGNWLRVLRATWRS